MNNAITFPELTDAGNADRLAERFAPQMRYVPETRQWLVWNNNIWQHDIELRVKQMAIQMVRETSEREANYWISKDDGKRFRNHCKTSQNHGRLKAMLEIAKSHPELLTRQSDLDKDPMLLTCANGTLDLRTGQLREARQEDLITQQNQIEYDPDLLEVIQTQGLAEVAPHFARFLDDIAQGCPRLNMIEQLQIAIGYTLTGDTSEERFFYIYGPGANGKTKLLEIICKLLGDSGMKSRMQTFLEEKSPQRRRHQSELARLADQRYVYASEANKDRNLDPALVCEITGGERIAASKKYRDEFEFRPRFKLWFASNHAPWNAYNHTALSRRIIMFPFLNTIPEERRDRYLIDKLCKELPMILAWAAIGCLRWQRDE